MLKEKITFHVAKDHEYDENSSINPLKGTARNPECKTALNSDIDINKKENNSFEDEVLSVVWSATEGQ